MHCGDLLLIFPYVPVAHVFQEFPEVLFKSPTFQHTCAQTNTHTHTVIISVVVHAIYANYQLHYALLECSRLGCLRGCPGGGGELISSRTRATHGQLPIESIDARETGAKKTRIPRMRRASFERYFRGWQDQRDFLCA